MAMMVGAGSAREGENGMLEKETRQVLQRALVLVL